MKSNCSRYCLLVLTIIVTSCDNSNRNHMRQVATTGLVHTYVHGITKLLADCGGENVSDFKFPDAIFKNPGVRSWRGPYLQGEPKFVDYFGTKLEFLISNKVITVVSAGADRRFGTKDDIVESVTYPLEVNPTRNHSTRDPNGIERLNGFSATYASHARESSPTSNCESGRFLILATQVLNCCKKGFPNSPLVGQITFKQKGTTRMTTTKSYDSLNRLTQISSQAGASGLEPVAFNYSYNTANQRTQNTMADGSYWIYGYDSLGQVTNACKFWRDGTPVAGQQFGYAFDTIGNRTQTRSGGDQSGAGLRPASYIANNLNQLTNRDVPGYVDIKGVSLATNVVTVNGQTAYRKWEYFRAELTNDNSSAALWTNIIVAATGQSSVTGNVFVAKSPEIFKYDADGNMTNDGRWVLTWDAENRLTQAESLANTPDSSKRKVTWEFDAKGRRIRQTTYDESSGSAVVTEDLKFISDGWRHVAELNATNNTLVRSYTWGLDLSGSMDGAGGVGGLLMMNSAANGVHFYAYDGNGNVVALVKASDGTISANYEYEAFGQPIRETGLTGKENPFRFSTKRTDNTTDFVLYEMRPYIPPLGRWPNRDPMEEDGGVNLYNFCKNASITEVDDDGCLYYEAPEVTSEYVPEAEACGYHDLAFPLYLSNYTPKQGVAVQKVHVVTKIHYCCWYLTDVDDDETFWEYMGQVVKNAEANSYIASDADAYLISNKRSKGSITVTTTVKFFFLTTTRKDPYKWGWDKEFGPPTKFASQSTTIQPPWWNNPPDNNEPTTSRSTSTMWDCCGPEKNYSSKTTHNP